MRKGEVSLRCTIKQKFALLLVLVIFFSGCASMTLRKNGNQSGHPFIGVRQDAAGIMCAWSGAFDQKNEFPWYFATPVAMVSSFVLFTDMVLSFCIDLVYLPKDLIDEPTELPPKTCAPFHPESQRNRN